MESWKPAAIWAWCWRCERPRHWYRIQHPDKSFKCSGDGHGTCEAYSFQLWGVCDYLCHKWGEDCPHSLLVVWGNWLEWSSPEKLRPSTGLHFSGKWIISTIVFITDMVHLALTKITFCHAAMVYPCKNSIDYIYRFRTKSPTEIRKMVAWPLAMDRFTCRRTVCQVSSQFPSCLIVGLTFNLGVQVSICSDWNCGSYSPDILLWHITNVNER